MRSSEVVRRVQVQNWEDFLDAVHRISPGPPGQALFRGQADAARELRPALSRLGQDFRLRPQDLRVRERSALVQFREGAHLWLPPSCLPDAEVREQPASWLMLMQHYGIPTRLLDWTVSPYVAAYFAVEKHRDKPGAVWGIDHGDWLVESREHANSLLREMTLAEDVEAQDLPRLAFLKPDRPTDRMLAQGGWFSISDDPRVTVEIALGKILNARPNLTGERPSPLTKIEIPLDQKREFLIRLLEANVTAASLFPGADGFGRAVASSLRLGIEFELEAERRRIEEVEKTLYPPERVFRESAEQDREEGWRP
jgi:FRG domain